jgi:hypothetical protein
MIDEYHLRLKSTLLFKKAKCIFMNYKSDRALYEALFALDEAILLNDKYYDAYELRADILF